MRPAFLSVAAFLLFCCGCVPPEWLGPAMTELGEGIQRQGERQTSAMVRAIERGDEVRIKDFLAPLALLLGGGTLAGGGALISRNGRRKNGGNNAPG